ncbi:MAG TPA: tRNA (adenosine(37)-N6)-threonylcarbamoyltransferase complex ATPase subunit type 1 TsaE [Candidatus Thiothrix moscowensis]|uniref:tRNA (adenosine(37)-N6)-threonylcarbamoyltransferase complex ATPase subunit type 1 TsaE n=1 Tax=unclassified Thiothrix TaxID=2636184 RepID=UPI001A286233|nr:MULTISPECIES: tRNA (adenosine(37)-N6)-threonylcarbamoyltransferase complex ATPase subunit type 1 TsaE [unclassified Thiothrix]MBJ6608725.1 tRNA (adenosine(37)-N6)-threonylcarbamoyltransferase complex ATPase subunit type 1 TsaE [Candidatus Thiothrix moscowensis]HRJ52652.1 tRNA (adenosine(37)-N6)-threonylcarbamoyltransferase complex ATPase subunit type 1 TsaE [Candidatus Thiothrix moscowensis]HRJ92864.1 tRNA (adenosine(37)-N6)-threonylcarbamoyltransferase complex ATPase subunit type 1 TsaE [Can
MTESLQIHDETEMLALGARLARRFPAGGLITLHGDLGAGKTTLVRGLLRELGHTGVVKSPTYTLVEPYHLAGRDIYHFDLYRLAEAEELEYMGIRDYLRPDALCLVEWPEKAGDILPIADLQVFIHHAGSERRVELS